MAQYGTIRIHGNGGIAVDQIAAYLSDLKSAYDSLLVFEIAADRLSRGIHDQAYPFRYALPSADLFGKRSPRYSRDWRFLEEDIPLFIPRREALVLKSVELASPGFWEFLGTLNPLQVIREYLNDRHERRKDKEYREEAEARRLDLENFKLENEVIGERIRIMKDMGLTDRDLAPLVNRLIDRTLTSLDRHQDAGVIEYAELTEIGTTATGSAEPEPSRFL